MAEHRRKIEEALVAGAQATSSDMVEACIRSLRGLLLQAPVEETAVRAARRSVQCFSPSSW